MRMGDVFVGEDGCRIGRGANGFASAEGTGYCVMGPGIFPWYRTEGSAAASGPTICELFGPKYSPYVAISCFLLLND